MDREVTKIWWHWNWRIRVSKYKSLKWLDISEIVVSNKFFFDKQDFKYLIGYKYRKEIRPWCILFIEMSIYKRYSVKAKCVYFMIKVFWWLYGNLGKT